MTITEYQKSVDELLQGYDKPYWHPLSQFARLSEEVGEVSRILNATYGDKPKKPSDSDEDLGDELSDIIWTVVCLANSQGIDLEPHMKAQFDKLTVRDKNRFKKK